MTVTLRCCHRTAGGTRQHCERIAHRPRGFVGAETKLDVFERGTGQFPAWRVVMADRCRGRTGVKY
jgi:hypothetical protein